MTTILQVSFAVAVYLVALWLVRELVEKKSLNSRRRKSDTD